MKTITFCFRTRFGMIDALERESKQFELVLYTQKTHAVNGPEAQHVERGHTRIFRANSKKLGSWIPPSILDRSNCSHDELRKRRRALRFLYHTWELCRVEDGRIILVFKTLRSEEKWPQAVC